MFYWCARPKAAICAAAAKWRFVRIADIEWAKMLRNCSNDRFGETEARRRVVGSMSGLGRLWRRPSGLDFDSFGDHQRIFKLDAEVPDSAVHLGVTQQQLDQIGRASCRERV